MRAARARTSLSRRTARGTAVARIARLQTAGSKALEVLREGPDYNQAEDDNKEEQSRRHQREQHLLTSAMTYVLLLLLGLLGLPSSFSLRVLVLGGSGFVGSKVVSDLSTRGHSVTSLSRRAVTSECKNVRYVQGDASDADVVGKLSSLGPFDAAVHCIGLLLDGDSGLSSLNQFASGSGSVPSASSSYDLVTRKTALNLIDLLEAQGAATSLVFVSAAEAAWTFPAPVAFLERYLVAKRAVEKRMLSSSSLRPTILRPSLIYTLSRPQALVSVVPFYVANAIGVPFVDRPVSLETLSSAAVYAVENASCQGIKTYREMDTMAASLR